MDVFIEHIVKHRLQAKNIIIMLAVAFSAMMITLVAGVFFAVPAFRFFVLLIIAGAWYGAFWVVKSSYVEYEYTMTNSSIDIDKIMGKSRRKRVISIDCHEVEICAAIDDSMHNGEFKSNAGISKVIDCTGYGDNDIYFLDIVNDKGKIRILFEPKESMIENAQKFNPRKIFKKN